VLQSDAAGLSPAERLDRLDAALTGQRPDLLVTPELYLSGYNLGEALPDLAEPQDDPGLTAAAGIARTHGTALVPGFAERAGCENGLTCLGGSRIVGPDRGEDAVSGAGPGLISADIDRARTARARLPYLRAAPRDLQD